LQVAFVVAISELRRADPTSVRHVYLGVGDRTDLASNGFGLNYIDDIRGLRALEGLQFEVRDLLFGFAA
jgi:hypothetical protein